MKYEINDYVITMEEETHRQNMWLYKSKIVEINDNIVTIIDLYSYNKKTNHIKNEQKTRESEMPKNTIPKSCIISKVSRSFNFKNFNQTHPEYSL